MKLAVSDETGVTEVTRVTPSIHAGSERYPNEGNGVTGVTPDGLKIEAVIERPGFSVHNGPFQLGGRRVPGGVWFHGHKGSGENQTEYDQWICSPLHIEAITHSDNADFGRLVRFKNSNGQWHELALPMEMLAGSGEEMRRVLLNRGVEISPDGHRLLNAYIQGQHPKRRITAATRTGWHGDGLFILPSRTIGEGDAVYQSEDVGIDDYRQAGTLEGWQSDIGAYCRGNPLALAAIGSAFAGPLLYHLKRAGGGIHFVGDSSTGKTTLLTMASSVWGNPADYLRTWRATVNGLEGIAALRNDCLLALDEIGEASPREVGAMAYALANGVGKARASRTGAARAARRWRVIVLSSGELSLEGHMREAGQQARAGQEVRMLTVSAKRQHGAWDELHGHADGRKFSDAMVRAASSHYGHAGPVFVERLIKAGYAARLGDALAALVQRFKANGGQEGRAAERFAILALAAETAIQLQVLPVPQGEPTKAMIELYRAWCGQRGEGQSEAIKIISAVSDFLDRNGDAMFSAVSDAAIIRDRAGWWRDTEDGRVWMFTGEGLRRAVPGYETGRVLDALDDAGRIADRDYGKRSKATRIGSGTKRLYHIWEVEHEQAV